MRLRFDSVEALREVGFRGLTSKGWRIYFISHWIDSNPWLEDYFLSLEASADDSAEVSMCEVTDTCIFSKKFDSTPRLQKLKRAIDIARYRYIM